MQPALTTIHLVASGDEMNEIVIAALVDPDAQVVVPLQHLDL
jgi:hypothetical protein